MSARKSPRAAKSRAAQRKPEAAAKRQGNGDDTRHASYNHSNLLRFPSMLGLPGSSIPCGISPDGMPIGMQIIGALFADQTVLNAALAYQSLTDWHRQKPPLCQ